MTALESLAALMRLRTVDPAAYERIRWQFDQMARAAITGPNLATAFMAKHTDTATSESWLAVEVDLGDL